MSQRDSNPPQSLPPSQRATVPAPASLDEDRLRNMPGTQRDRCEALDIITTPAGARSRK